jgi:hypothetical protein
LKIGDRNPRRNGPFSIDDGFRGSCGLDGGGGSRAKLVSDAGTGNFLKISGQNRLQARKQGPPVRNSTALSASCTSVGRFPVILHNRQFKRRNRH